MFKQFFKTDISELTEAEKKDDSSKEQKSPKIVKIKDDFETELRKLYKIKSVIYTAFGVQIDFLKKPERNEILALLESPVKFKGNSIFIEF